MPQKPAVIVLNSLVARGSVGGRATSFVLERLGFPVWSVPTLVLPWHLGHGRATRIAATPEAFAGLLADLGGSPHLSEVGAVVSGYLAGIEQAEPIARLVSAVKAANPRATYLCDPIIGDSEGLFQPAAVAEAIRDSLLPLADMATPNRHELAWLTGGAVGNNREIVAAARRLGPAEVVVTSAFAGGDGIGNLLVDDGSPILVGHERLPAASHGTGDLFSAVYLGHRLDGAAPAEALQRAASATFALIRQAVAEGLDEMPLAAGQGRFAAPAAGVSLDRLSG